ncbi:MAG: TFIIB-type zinc ribbon-containing protein [Pseudomonadota bacterium]
MVSAAPPGVAQSALQCPKCAGQSVFDPNTGGLTCSSCGHVRDLSHPDDADAHIEYGYDPSAPEEEPASRPETLEHHCATCSGSVIFMGQQLSENCPYCDGAVVLSQPVDGYDTMALIPFSVDDPAAQVYAQAWATSRIAAPSDLADHVEPARVAGLYAPFWTFDSQEAVQYWAKYTTGSGDNKRTHSVSGDMTIDFDDLLVPASPHVTPLIRDGILHEFQPDKLRSYRAGYLAGFAAERHHMTVAQGLEANRKDKRLLIRNRIKQHINRSRVHSIRFRTDTTGIHYRRILLPVWILHYTYWEKPYKIVVSGINGRTFGERPFSKWKLAGYSALISAAVIGFGLLWGAAGWL